MFISKDILNFLMIYLSYNDLCAFLYTCKYFKQQSLDLQNKKATVIQKHFKHFLNCKKIRILLNSDSRLCFYKLKNLQIISKLDGYIFNHISTNFKEKYRKYIEYILNNLNIYLNQDDDDEEKCFLSIDQLNIISNIKLQKNISISDIKTILKCLTLRQLQFI